MFLGRRSKAVSGKKHGPPQSGQDTVEEYHHDLAEEAFKETY